MGDQKPCDEKTDAPEHDCVFYLDVMSHDLLNYNQAVLGYLDLVLADESISAESKRYVTTAIKQLRSSSQLIDDMKKIAHLGFIGETTLEELPLDKIVESSMEELRFLYPERDVVVNLTNNARGAKVKGTDALRDVCLNLLTNAVKFDKSEKVMIDVSIVRPAGAKGMVDLVVEDRGAGISDPLKKVIAGESVPDDRSKRISGMGLLIVRAATKRFGGRLLIDDRVQGDHTKGAKLTVRLPEVY